MFYLVVNKHYLCGPFLCRFSPFVKTGTESFVLGAATVKSGIPDRLQVAIIVSPEGTYNVMYYKLSLVLCRFLLVMGTSTMKIDTLIICCWFTGTPMWEPNPEAHTVTVREPSKQKKFKGIKTFTAYQIVPSSTGRAVSRRYKHYDWFHSRLEEKFTLNSVPPLPDKQYYGNKLFAETIPYYSGKLSREKTFTNL